MALSIAMAITNFDTNSFKAVKRRLQVRDYFFRNLPPREIRSPTGSEASSGYSSTDTIISSSTSIDSRRQSLSESLLVSQLIAKTESETDSVAEQQEKSEEEKRLEKLIESILEPLLQVESRGVCSEDFPKDVLQEDLPRRLIYGNRDILNLGANIRKPMWPKIPEHDDEEGRKEIDSVFFRGKAYDQCPDCSFADPSSSFCNGTKDSTDKNVKKQRILCCDRERATERHDFRVICRKNIC